MAVTVLKSERMLNIERAEALLKTLQPSLNSRSLAIHEAGHAAMHWFLGEAEVTDLIDMRGNAHTSKMITVYMLNNFVPRQFQRCLAIREIMAFLAGPAAESRHNCRNWSDRLHWFTQGLADWSTDRRSRFGDFGQATEYAQVLYTQSGEWYRFLTTVAQWTQEALEIPAVWKGVEALADRLEFQNTMRGSVAAKLLSHASGFAKCPLDELGEPWWGRCRIQGHSSTWDDIQRDTEKVRAAIRRAAPHLSGQIRS